MQIRTEDLLRALMFVVEAAAKPKANARLARVHFVARDSTLRVEATNGHWLARYDAPLVDVDGDALASWCLHVDAAVWVVRALKALPPSENVTLITIGPREVRFGGGAPVLRDDAEAYPDTDGVLRGLTPGKHDMIAVSAGYMATIARMFDRLDPRSKVAHSITLTPGKSELDPILIRSGDPSFGCALVALMPVRR